MALDVIQVEGCYVSSSLPKALFVPSYHRSRRDLLQSSDTLYFKPKRKSTDIKNVASNCGEPLAGRQHLSVQTDLYLEELCDVVEEADAQCETDPFLDRPPSPLFIPAKSGPDVATQIYPGDLFDFDEEVEPLLEALVGQTIEQALIEIMAEEELAVLSDLQMDYEARRNAEVAEVKRLEEQERRLYEEKEKRIKEQEEAILLEDEVAQKIVACIFSQNYLSELVPQVYKKLEVEGYFETEDPDMLEIEETFWPWLMNEVDSEIATLEASCHLLDTLIDDTVHSIAETSVIHPVTKKTSVVNPVAEKASDINPVAEKASDINPVAEKASEEIYRGRPAESKARRGPFNHQLTARGRGAGRKRREVADSFHHQPHHSSHRGRPGEMNQAAQDGPQTGSFWRTYGIPESQRRTASSHIRRRSRINKTSARLYLSLLFFLVSTQAGVGPFCKS